MVFAGGEGGEPHVQVVLGLVGPVQQVSHHTRIVAVLRKDVNVAWVSRNLEAIEIPHGE